MPAMSELRWTLLILGVVFIVALSWWERRRPRQAFAPHLRDGGPSLGGTPRLGGAEGAGAAEPWIGDDGLSDVVPSDMALANDEDVRGPDAESDAESYVEPAAPGPLEELPTVVISDGDDRLELAAAWDDQAPEPKLIDPETSATGELPQLTEPVESADPIEVSQPAESSHPVAVSEPEIAGAEGVGEVRIVEPAVQEESPPPPQVIVEWPPEESRRILALRLVAPHAERFAGRALRLAMAAEGFLLGRFSIFHKPDSMNRALLSAASLNRPGAFDLETMDSQRYGGLSLFVVLPGPRTPQQAFEELLSAARNLNERLEGALQDERGNPLTALRVQSIRESLRGQATPPTPPAAAHGA
jgi:cell division protein ZipA